MDYDIAAVTDVINEMATQLYNWGWIDTTGGSFSVRDPNNIASFWLTPAGSGFRRWNLKRDGILHLDADLSRLPDSTAQKPGHPSALVHRQIFELFPHANAVIHTHSPFSLTFACKNRSVEPLTLHSQIIGSVPCFTSDVDEILNRNVGFGSRIPIQRQGTRGRDYVYTHFERLGDQLQVFASKRSNEVTEHGLAFTVYKHGIFVLARTLDEAFDNLIRVERNAQVQILSSLID